MDTMTTIFSRTSVRNFTGDKIPATAMEAIMKAANAAPVAMGQYENVHLTVMENQAMLRAIEENAAKAFGKPDMRPLYGAPVFVLVSARPRGEIPGNIEYSNAAIVVQNMALAAVEQGVGCCHIWGATMMMEGNPDLLRQLNLPEGFSPCCGMVLGMTAEHYGERNIPMDRISVNYVK